MFHDLKRVNENIVTNSYFLCIMLTLKKKKNVFAPPPPISFSKVGWVGEGEDLGQVMDG